MARRSIDMLPLLDVFMVVLFVFATIQETQLDDSVQALDETREALARTTDERDQHAQRAAELDKQVARLEREATQASEQLAEYERLNPDAQAQVAVAALHERLLDNIAVFEVDIDGEPDLVTGTLHNRCCFRVDPPRGEWRSCGEVPSDEAELLIWLDDGADGLVEGLGRTRGGNAVVVLRQGEGVRYRLSNDLAELLRERMPSHRIYDDGINAGAPRCPQPSR